MKITLLGRRVILQPLNKNTETDSGTILSEKEERESSLAEVVAHGPLAELFKVGDIVIIADVDFDRLELEDKKYLIGDAEDVLGIYENNT